MLNQPYPFLYSTRKNSLIILLISIVVFLINFSINEDHVVKQNFHTDRLTFSIGFAMISGFFVLIVLELIPLLFFKDELKENWTLSKEGSLIVGLFTLIILANYLFILITARDFELAFQVKTFILVVFQGIFIGLVPAFVAILINYNAFLRKNLKEVKVYNEQLVKRLPVEVVPFNEEVLIPTNNKSETIRIVPSQLWFVKSEGNYVEIFFEIDNKVKKEVYRTSIKVIEEALQDYPHIIKTHRCYLANLQKVINFKGNARNFQLYFDDSDTMVPVSRNKFEAIQDCMKVI